MNSTLPNNYKLNNRYTILHQIGQGGFGITYKAHDSVFDRIICIKELFIKGNSRRDERWSVSSQAIGNIQFGYFKDKFLDEAKKLAKFNHPNIVKVLEYFETNNTAYMVMEYLEGKSLKQYVINKGKLTEEESIKIFEQLLDATEAIHDSSFLHRDIKPDNIIITPENKAILIDFGTAKFHDNESVDTSTLILLSHGYAAPERYSNKHQKGNYTDIYALGATLYFMLTGEKPVQATDRVQGELKRISEFNPTISKKLTVIVSKAMDMKIEKRYQSVSELQKQIKLIKHSKDGLKELFVLFSFLVIILIILNYNGRTTEVERGTSEKMGDSVIEPSSDTSQQITIGNQVWMTKNLNVDRFRNGDPIPEAKTVEEWRKAGDNQQPAWCYYDNDPANGEKFGKLYNWYALIDSRGLASEGWHVPNYAEFKTLVNSLGGKSLAGKQLKNTVFWKDSGGGNNNSRFSANPGGTRRSDGTFGNLSEGSYFWIDSLESPTRAWFSHLGWTHDSIIAYHTALNFGLSVRCIRDKSIISHLEYPRFDSFNDPRDSKKYKTIKIGKQIWMTENLSYKPASGKYWANENQSFNVSKYGYFYDWETACEVCPSGWRLPSASDWDLLMKTLGGKSAAGVKMKDTTGWSENGNGNNNSLFSGLPGGFVDLNQSYNDKGVIGYWWVATAKNSSNQSLEKKAYRYLHSKHDYLGQDMIHKNFLLSVRCIKDNYNQ